MRRDFAAGDKSEGERHEGRVSAGFQEVPQRRMLTQMRAWPRLERERNSTYLPARRKGA